MEYFKDVKMGKADDYVSLPLPHYEKFVEKRNLPQVGPLGTISKKSREKELSAAPHAPAHILLLDRFNNVASCKREQGQLQKKDDSTKYVGVHAWLILQKQLSKPLSPPHRLPLHDPPQLREPLQPKEQKPSQLRKQKTLQSQEEELSLLKEYILQQRRKYDDFLSSSQKEDCSSKLTNMKQKMKDTMSGMERYILEHTKERRSSLEPIITAAAALTSAANAVPLDALAAGEECVPEKKTKKKRKKKGAGFADAGPTTSSTSSTSTTSTSKILGAIRTEKSDAIVESGPENAADHPHMENASSRPQACSSDALPVGHADTSQDSSAGASQDRCAPIIHDSAASILDVCFAGIE